MPSKLLNNLQANDLVSVAWRDLFMRLCRELATDFRPEEILQLVREGRFIAWGYDQRTLLITELQCFGDRNFPRRILCVLFCVGEATKRETVMVMQELEGIAKANDCGKMRLVAREGFVRWLPDYEREGIVLIKSL